MSSSVRPLVSTTLAWTKAHARKHMVAKNVYTDEMPYAVTVARNVCPTWRRAEGRGGGGRQCRWQAAGGNAWASGACLQGSCSPNASPWRLRRPCHGRGWGRSRAGGAPALAPLRARRKARTGSSPPLPAALAQTRARAGRGPRPARTWTTPVSGPAPVKRGRGEKSLPEEGVQGGRWRARVPAPSCRSSR